MSYQDPNQQPYPGSSQYGGYTPQPQPTDPYSGQQYGQPGAAQQPGYQQPGQPGYQQTNYNPYGQQQYGAPGAQTSIGMAQNTAAGLSYVLGWVSGLIIFLMEKQNRFVRFHAAQSLFFFGSLTVLDILLNIVGYIPGIGIISWLAPLVNLVGFVGWIVLMVNGFQGKYFKLPVIGDYAERYANQGLPPQA